MSIATPEFDDVYEENDSLSAEIARIAQEYAERVGTHEFSRKELSQINARIDANYDCGFCGVNASDGTICLSFGDIDHNWVFWRDDDGLHIELIG
jgi:hypothetical protein